MIESKTIASKLPINFHAEVIRFCKKEGLKPSTLIKELLESEVSSLVPHNKAGRNALSYNKQDDLFTWYIEYDTGEKKEVAKNLSPLFVKNALKALQDAILARDAYIQKTDEDSIPAPTKIKKVID